MFEWQRWMAAILVLWLSGCSTIYYSVWETLGREKRDLLRSNVEAVREDQEDVSEQFESTLEHIRELYGLADSDLEKTYDRIKSDFERSQEKAETLRNRIERVDKVATDLFEEWAGELEMISDSNLRDKSRQQLDATKARYRRLARSLQASEAAMDPVLQKFQDQVLFLKHNLNAQAVGSLETEMEDIEREVRSLIQDLQRSIQQTEAFIRDIPA